jgi:hypothetical protein
MCIATPRSFYFRRSVLIKEHCSASAVVVLDLAGNFEWQAGVILSMRFHHCGLDSKHMDLREQQDNGSRGKALRNDGVLSQVAGRLGVILWFAICERTVHRHQRAYAYAFPDTVFGSGFSPEELIIYRG